LEHKMKPVEAQVERHLEAPQNGGLDLFERDLQARNG